MSAKADNKVEDNEDTDDEMPVRTMHIFHCAPLPWTGNELEMHFPLASISSVFLDFGRSQNTTRS